MEQLPYYTLVPGEVALWFDVFKKRSENIHWNIYISKKKSPYILYDSQFQFTSSHINFIYALYAMPIVFIKAIPGETGSRTDFFQIWNNN